MAGESREPERVEGVDFIRAIVARHNAEGTYGGRVITRFPPEPNGFLHIGHAKSIVLNFGLAQENGGRCHLRFDDTNPLTEELRYVEAIQQDVRWLGYDWGEHLYFASDYFERLYECALILIRKGKAYVDSLSEEEIRLYRGTLTEPGKESPYRNRSVEENLDLFRRMRAGEFPDGAHVLRAKIDMAHPNMVMRDPVLYRIRHATHYRTGDAWCIYPLYDFTHCLSDAFEGITHSLCTLEFENNRELYDWILDEVGFEEPRPHQYEFARLNLDYTVMSKRKLLRLVNEGHVDGWDDPRMPTLAGMRRRGIPPEAIRTFCEMIGVARADNRVDLGKLEFAVRDHLNRTAPRRMGVLRPLRLVITNYPEGQVEELEIPSFPPDVGLPGSRRVPFSRELFIEAEDFALEPPPGYRRLAPGRRVRLRYAYVVECREVVRDPATGAPREVRCVYDPASRGAGGRGEAGLGIIHWVSAPHAVPAEVRLYDRLFSVPDPEADEGRDFTDFLNPLSKVVLETAYVEPAVAEDPPGTRIQLERLGYFAADPVDCRPGRLVLNRIVTLRDTWARRREAAGQGGEPGVERGRSGAVGVLGRAKGEGRGEGGTAGGGDDAGEAPPSPLPPVERRDGGREARDAVRRRHPELADRFRRYQVELGLTEEQADLVTGSPAAASLFQEALDLLEGRGAVTLANWVVNEVLRVLKARDREALPFGPSQLASLVRLLEDGILSQPMAKEIFQEVSARGADPLALVAERGLRKVTQEEAVAPLVERVLAAWPEKVEEYRRGKTGLLGFFTGLVLKESGGRADPRLVRQILVRSLEEGGAGGEGRVGTGRGEGEAR